MAKVDLKSMSLDDLRTLKKNVETAIADFELRRKKEAVEAVKAAAKDRGFKLEELLGASPKKGKAKAPPKYAHPDSAALTWSGRGRQPGWIKEALAEGKSLPDFAI